MARINALYPLGDQNGTQSITAGTAGAVVTVGHDKIIMVNASDDVGISFGLSTGKNAAASAASFRIPGGSNGTFPLGSAYDQFQLFNNTGATVTAWWTTLGI